MPLDGRPRHAVVKRASAPACVWGWDPRRAANSQH
uniref:Uncharacterized protein n=1 Tax=Anguilla anguilla TaxID=7936 RepID=A0A0E9Q0E9_ANGAN